MTLHSTCDAPTEASTPTPQAERPPARGDDDTVAGWDALALAELGRPLTPAERALIRSHAAEDALDRLFPGLPDAARQEALWALG